VPERCISTPMSVWTVLRANRFAAWGHLLAGGLPDDEQQHLEDHGTFFHQTLPG
jgi:hypothetical protein